MSKAYVCDKCGKMQPEPMKSIWTTNPAIFSGGGVQSEFNLCDKCYYEFDREYLASLNECGGRP